VGIFFHPKRYQRGVENEPTHFFFVANIGWKLMSTIRDDKYRTTWLISSTPSD